MKPDAPVMAPASPGGARRAISDNCTPFQPIPVAPKHAATRSKAASGQAGLKPTVPNANPAEATPITDRKSTRLNSSHSQISYAVFCLKKKKDSRNFADPDPRQLRYDGHGLSCATHCDFAAGCEGCLHKSDISIECNAGRRRATCSWQL